MYHRWLVLQTPVVKLELRKKRLTHLFPMHPYGFLMFSWDRERVHWEQMGEDKNLRTKV